jgi:hypothetical protein
VEVWNLLGRRLIPKLRALKGLLVCAEFAGELDPATQAGLVGELKKTIEELGLSRTLRVDQTQVPDRSMSPSSSQPSTKCLDRKRAPLAIRMPVALNGRRLLFAIGDSGRINGRAESSSEPNDGGLPLLLFDHVDVSYVSQRVTIIL